MARRPETSRPFVLYAVAVSAAAAAVLVLSWQHESSNVVPGVIAVLVVSVVVAEAFAVEIPDRGSMSLSYPLTVAAFVTSGPAAGMVVAAFSGVSLREIRSGRPPAVFLFNVGQLMLTVAAAGWTYLLLGGSLLASADGAELAALDSAGFAQSFVPLLAAAFVGWFVNTLLMSGAVYLVRGVSPARLWREGLLKLAPTEVALAGVGFAIAEVLAINPLGPFFFVFPLLVARGVYLNYVRVQEAFVDTLRFFAGFLEAKDPYTKGHSERVAEYSVEIGQAMGLTDRDLLRLEYAALLHDMGKVRVPSAVLNKPGRLTDEEYDLIKRHPEDGAELVSRIPYFAELSDLVAAHHEAYDGRGYGRGLTGPDIPLLARVMAAADAYDAMTSERSYRAAMSDDEAKAELRRCSGSQFDPDVITAWLGHENERPRVPAADSVPAVAE